MGNCLRNAGLPLLLLALLAACGAPGTGYGARAVPPAPVAVWSYLDLAGSPQERPAFFQFAASARVHTLYLGAGTFRPEAAEAWAGLLEEARAQGIGVSLVLGRAAWTRPDQRQAALERVRAVREFAAALGRAGRARPVSLQLDVEPHALPDWDRDWARLGGEYLDLLEAVRTELQGELPLWVDIPVWWDGRRVRHQGRTRPLDQWVIDLADQTVLMDYRNQTRAILAGAEHGLACAAAAGRPVVLGLAVHCARDGENRTSSFCRLGHRALIQAMGDVHAKLAARGAYAGMAVFTYEDWRNLGR